MFIMRDPPPLQYQRIPVMIQSAMRFEKTMFEIATSQEEYYQLMAQKTDWFCKEFERRWRIKNELMRMGGG